MIEPTKVEKVINKIKALRAVANSTHSKAEKETAITLAAKLIAEYQLSEAEVEAQTGKAAEQDDLKEGTIVYETGRTTPWKSELVVGLSELNNVFCLKFPIRDSVSHKQGSRYRVFGRRSDSEICKYMFDYLREVIEELVDDYVPGGRKRGINPERESWCLGCVRGFLFKMKQERQGVLQLASSSAMVLVNRQEQLKEAWMEANDRKIRSTAASKAKHQADTFQSGFRKGQTLEVNAGLNEGNPKETKKLGQ